ALAEGPIPKSRFILDYEARRGEDKKLPALRWTPVAAAQLPEALGRAVVLAEDSRFWMHHGIDWEEVKAATADNLEHGEVMRGASTISQQTVKNLFLRQELSFVSNRHELVLTWGLEQHVAKR